MRLALGDAGHRVWEGKAGPVLLHSHLGAEEAPSQAVSRGNLAGLVLIGMGRGWEDNFRVALSDSIRLAPLHQPWPSLLPTQGPAEPILQTERRLSFS